MSDPGVGYRTWLREMLGTLRRKIDRITGKRLIADSGLFLPDWYNQQNNDVRSKGIDPLSHYCAYGAYEGRDPNPLFDNEWYRQVHLAGREDLNPLLHFLKHGARAGLRPHPVFDPAWYAAHSNSGLALSAGTLRHFLEEGAAIGLAPNAQWSVDLPGAPAQTSPRDAPVGEAVTVRTAADGRSCMQPTAVEVNNAYFSALMALAECGDDWTRAEIRRALGVARSSGGAVDDDRLAQPLVSIIMPVFNRRAIVGDAIRSVLDQRYSNFECIICDDGSTDGTADAIDALVKADDRITMLRNAANEGAAAARNKCLKTANGEYFAYIDSDNIWHPCFLSLMVAALARREDCQFAYASYFDAVIGEDVRYLRPTRYRAFFYDLQVRNPYIDLNSLVHRSRLYEVYGGFDSRLKMLQDYDMIRRYTLDGEVLHVPIALNLYRRIQAIGRLSEGNRTEALGLIEAKYRNKDRK
jgi:hypothetical protein